MSIDDILKERIEQRRLVQVLPVLGGNRERIVLATLDVFKELDPETAMEVTADNSGQLRAWLDGFSNGRRVTVGSGRNRHVDVKILDPVRDEVWEFRKRDHPSTRIFGRFASRDVFVATNIRTAHDLFSFQWVKKGRPDVWPVWRKEIRRCKATWRSLFDNYPPVSGGHLDDYLSNAIDERTR